MKICLISNLYEPFARGGAEQVAKTMAEGLAERGHEVVVVSTKPSRGVRITMEGKIKIYRFMPLNLFFYLNDYKHNAFVRSLWHLIDIFNYHSYFIVQMILAKEQPDLVITHNLMGAGFLIPLLIRKFGVKHIHVLHDVQLAVASGLIIKNEENSFLVSGWPMRLYSLLCKKLFGSPEVVVSPSKWLLDFYASKGFFVKSKRIVLPNPVDASSREPSAREKKHGRFLFVGQLEEHKGIGWLVDFWEKNNIAEELLIVGEGGVQLENLSANIRLLGRAKGEELNKIFAQADFLIVPSLCYENSPRVIQLALIAAAPPIVADIGGAAELIDDGRTGFVFEAGSKDSLLSAIRKARALSDTDYAKMSQACLGEVERFRLDEYLEKLLNY